MRLISLTLTILSAIPVHAQPFKMEPGPKSPADSLACIKTRPGFKVELMVSEPLVQSPIAFAWGPDGKFWVVEMGDYPLGVDGKGKPGGKIKYLEKTKPDGPYDKMTVFMGGLGFPTGVFPYKNGVLVTCAPDIFFAEVGKDGKATKKKVLFTGFKEGNQQHRVNGLVWGIDNWIYGANGDSGGVIVSLKTGEKVDIRGRDFRLKPDTGEFEAVSGQSQFGRCRDDWGNWFGNNNSNPMFHYVLEDRYLKRNPYVLYPDVRVQVPVKPGAQQVFPISKPMPRFNTPGALNHFTSACSTIIYRDTLFGKQFEGNMFVSEPVHNLIHREIMKPKGVTFTSQRADDEQTSEFLASSDNWFRPAMIQVGPDGALWIADMYRYVIEHPEWIPKDWQKKLDLRAGHERGRIYRVVPVDKKPREIVRLDKLKLEELVAQLESPSGWVRDTVQQMLIHSPGDTQVLHERLAKLASTTKLPQARLHAMYIDDEAGNRMAISFGSALTDPHPAVRKHAIDVMIYYGLRLQGNANIISNLARDRDSQVRQQLGYIFDEMLLSPKMRTTFMPIFVDLLCDAVDEPYVLAACLSSINKDSCNDFLKTLLRQRQIPSPILPALGNLVKNLGTAEDLNLLLLAKLGNEKRPPTLTSILELGKILDSFDISSPQARASLPIATLNILEKKSKPIHAEARKVAASPKASIKEKLGAIRLLACGLGDDREDQKLLARYLIPQTPNEVQFAVIKQFGRSTDPRVPNLLLAPWKGYSPPLRNQVLDTLFTWPVWTTLLLEKVKTNQVPASEIDAFRRQRFLQHPNPNIRARAQAIFATASDPNRGRVVDLYWLQMPDKGDAARGAKLFAKTCAACHKLGGVGQNVGPDLMSVGDKSPQGLLTAMLDPNRAVETRYINYVASTKKGLTYTGILSAETSTTITLTANDGKVHQLLRIELEDLSSTGKSMMPEGLEKDLTPRDAADLIAHVRAVIAAPKK